MIGGLGGRRWAWGEAGACALREAFPTGWAHGNFAAAMRGPYCMREPNFSAASLLSIPLRLLANGEAHSCVCAKGGVCEHSPRWVDGSAARRLLRAI
jgi:hypothetical protein